MKRNVLIHLLWRISEQRRKLFPFLLIMFLALAAPVFANGRISEEAEWTSTIVAIIIVIAGGLISLMGVYIVSRPHRGSSDVAIKIGPKLETKMTELTQGVVIVLLGVIVLVVGS